MKATMASFVGGGAAWLQAPLLGGQAFQFDRSTIALALIAFVLVLVLVSSRLGGGGGKETKVPIANPPGPFETWAQKKLESAHKGMEILHQARTRFGNKPYKMMTQSGPVIVLPRELASEIRNNPNLSFTRFVEDFPTQDAFTPLHLMDHPSELIMLVIKKHLTKRLNTVTKPLAQEATFVLDLLMGNKSDWTEANATTLALDIVTRLSNRIFLGPEMCRNEEWLDVSKNFTALFTQAVQRLSPLPRMIQNIVYLFDPKCQDLRSQRNRGRRIMRGLVEQRRRRQAECRAKGLPPPTYNDSVQWLQIEAGVTGVTNYDHCDFQLLLSFLAIHTTSDLLSQTMIYLAKYPESIEELRQEILEVLPVEGWNKTSLQKLKLLDSAVKEAQRFKPLFTLGLIRKPTEDTVLPNGLVVRKGIRLVMDTEHLMDPELYPEPEKFNIHRFADMRREPGGEFRAPLASVTADNLSFGLGKHACPGRFFAANEIKLALCHMLLKYDWRLAEGTSLEPYYFGTLNSVDPISRLLFKRRKEEIDLDALAVDDDVEE
ncbi:hypothetical protein RB597_002991 [Gaeumannomyces tritici]